MDDRTFRRLLRSALAMSFATPTLAIGACSGNADTDDDATAVDTNEAGTADSPIAAEAALEEEASPGDGGIQCTRSLATPTCQRVPSPEIEGGLHCGCGEMPFPWTACSVHRPFPCTELAESPAGYPADVCERYCGCTADGGSFASCRSVRNTIEDPDQPFEYPSGLFLLCSTRSEPGTPPENACGECGDPMPDLSRTCSWIRPRPCGLEPSDAMIPVADCERYCDPTGQLPPGEISHCAHNREKITNEPVLYCYRRISTNCPPAGRRPEGLVPGDHATGTPEGAFFAEAYRLEAASVDAFRILGHELTLHGAPEDLVRRAERARTDEVRHARMTARLARRLGAAAGAWEAPPIVVEAPGRSLETIATENAVEGCVHETYAALLALWQCDHAADRGVRAALGAIAEDETRHAALAWSVDGWLTSKLTAEERARVDAARRCALARLAGDAHRVPPPALRDAGLLPSPEDARRLVAALALHLGEAIEREGESLS